jgi:hypothetical protein
MPHSTTLSTGKESEIKAEGVRSTIEYVTLLCLHLYSVTDLPIVVIDMFLSLFLSMFLFIYIATYLSIHPSLYQSVSVSQSIVSFSIAFPFFYVLFFISLLCFI